MNAWILHKKIAKSKNEKSLTLAAFRIELSQALCLAGQINISRGKGAKSNHQSNEILNKQQKQSATITPIKDIRLDGVDHLPEVDAKRGRCKVPGCSGFSLIKCSKCKTHLCLNSSRNCFKNFHL